MERLGKNIILHYSGTTLAGAKSFDFEVNKQLVDVSSYDSAGWKKFLPSIKEWGGSISGLVIRQGSGTTAQDYEFILKQLINNDTPISVTILDTDASVKEISGTAYFSTLKMSASFDGEATYQTDFKGTTAISVEA